MTTEPQKKNGKSSSLGNLIGGGVLIALGISGVITVMTGKWEITHIHDVGTPCISLAMIIYGFVLLIKGIGTGLEGVATKIAKKLKSGSEQKKITDSRQKTVKGGSVAKAQAAEKVSEKTLEKSDQVNKKSG
jgi:hypothetical protein